MLRQIDYIVVHHTATASNESFVSLREKYRSEGRIPFHGVIDYYGNFHRLVGINTILDINCKYNDRCFHVAYIGNGAINNVHYQLLRRIEIYENAIEQEVEYPTLLYPINPMQQLCLRKKIAEIKGSFRNAEVIGIDKLSDQKYNPGFGVKTWLKEFTDGLVDEAYISQTFQEVFYEEEAKRNMQHSPAEEVWMFDETSDEQAYQQAEESEKLLNSLLIHESTEQNESPLPQEGISD